MAREVNTVLAQIIAEQRDVPESKAEEIVKSMRAANQYQVCVFLYILHHLETRLATASCILRGPITFANARAAMYSVSMSVQDRQDH
jgi:hypothetical protein